MCLRLRKQLFMAVREIPYQISSNKTDASCVAKTKLLGEMLSRIGLQCQVWKAQVRWDAIGAPPDLVSQAPRPTFNHFFLKVLLPETLRWVVVDATWDSRFQDSLPVNQWDGVSDTNLAYQSTQLELVGAVADFEYRNFDPTDRFTSELNAWYESKTKGTL